MILEAFFWLMIAHRHGDPLYIYPGTQSLPLFKSEETIESIPPQAPQEWNHDQLIRA